MTLKSYLRMLLAAVTLSSVAIGCDDSDEDVTPPPADENYTFTIEVSPINAADATVKVKPSEQQATYYFNVVEKQSFDAAASDDAFLQSSIEALKAAATEKGKTFADYLKSVISNGVALKKFDKLTPETEYYAYVYGIKTDGTLTSKLAKEAFTTEKEGVEPEGLTFEFKVENITKTAADVDVIPSNNEDTYYFDVQMVKAFEGMTEEEMLAAIVEDYVDVEYLTSGPDGYPAELFEQYAPLKPGTEYYVYAVGYDADKGATTKLFTHKFTTQAATGEAPDLQFAARAGDANNQNTSTKIYCSVLSLAAVSAKYACLPKATVDELIANGDSLENIVDTNGENLAAEGLAYLTKEPGLGLTLGTFIPSTAYTAIFKVVSAGGMSTVKSADVTTTADGGETGDGPNLTITAIPGKEGAETQTYITAMFKVTGEPAAVSGSYILAEKALVDQLVAEKGLTYEQITEAAGNEFTADNLTKLNANGIGWYFKELTPGTEHIVMSKVTDAAGNSTFKYIVASTDPAGEATTVELKNLAQGEMQYWGDAYDIAENDYANWTIYLADATVDLSTLNGAGDVLMMELNTAKSVTTEITPGTYTVMPNRSKANFIAFSCVPGYASGTTPYGTWYITEKSAKNMLTSGTVVVAKSGDNYTFTINLLDQATNTTFKGAYTGAMNYVDATAQSTQMRTPWANAANAPKRLASVAAMQNIVDAEMTAINSLSVEKKPAATYEATISNSAIIEKPLGLKKHFIKK